MRTLFDTPTAPDVITAHDGPVPPVSAVLFDFSNTLFRMVEADEWLRRVAADTGRADVLDVATVLDDVARAYRLPEVVQAQIGRDLDQERHRQAMVTWFTNVPWLRGHEHVAHRHVTSDESWVPYTDTRPVLENLRRRGVKVGIVSDFAWDLRSHLRHHDLAELVDTCALSYELGVEKPDPAIFLHACAALGADPRATLMVGDNPVRDGGSVHAGIRAFILPTEHRTGERGLAQIFGILDASRATR
jgi:HAD superfamily hydrolase (TIGR01509 family)